MSYRYTWGWNEVSVTGNAAACHLCASHLCRSQVWASAWCRHSAVSKAHQTQPSTHQKSRCSVWPCDYCWLPRVKRFKHHWGGYYTALGHEYLTVSFWWCSLFGWLEPEEMMISPADRANNLGWISLDGHWMWQWHGVDGLIGVKEERSRERRRVK